MDRRGFLTTVAASVGIAGVAGCVETSDSASDQPTDNSTSASPPKNNDTSTNKNDEQSTDSQQADETAVVDYSFGFVSPADGGPEISTDAGEFSAPPEIVEQTSDENGGTVTVSGIVSGRNGCLEARLSMPPSVDGTDIAYAVSMVTKEDIANEDSAVACPQAIVTRQYELTIEYTGQPEAIAANQLGMGMEPETRLSL